VLQFGGNLAVTNRRRSVQLMAIKSINCHKPVVKVAS